MNPSDVYKDAKAVHDRTESKEVKRIMQNVMKRVQEPCIDFRGEKFSVRCSCGCGEEIGETAVVLLGAGLIFAGEDHLVQFVGSRTANITVGGESYAPVDYLA